MSEEEFQKKLLIMQVMVGIHLKTMGDTITYLSNMIPDFPTTDEHFEKVQHFVRSQEVYDSNTANALGLMEKLYPEMVEQMFPVEH